MVFNGLVENFTTLSIYYILNDYSIFVMPLNDSFLFFSFQVLISSLHDSNLKIGNMQLFLIYN